MLLLFGSSVVSDSFVTPWTVAHQAPLSMGFSRQEYWSGFHFILEGISDTAIKLASPAFAGRFFTTEPLHLPGFSVHGILQARILERVAMPFSRGSSWPRNWTQVFCIAGRFFIIWATWEAHLYIYPFFFRFFSHINYYRILNIVPWAIQWVLMYYIYVCVYIC